MHQLQSKQEGHQWKRPDAREVPGLDPQPGMSVMEEMRWWRSRYLWDKAVKEEASRCLMTRRLHLLSQPGKTSLNTECNLEDDNGDRPQQAQRPGWWRTELTALGPPQPQGLQPPPPGWHLQFYKGYPLLYSSRWSTT